jgi:cytochrome c peroxidase
MIQFCSIRGPSMVWLVLTLVAPHSAARAEIDDVVKQTYKRPAEIPFPIDNPYTPEKAALGKALYFDSRLPGAQNMNCATCHNPSFGWEVPVKTPVGAQNKALARQSPTVLDVAWVHPLFWDGRAPSAEEQAKGPIQSEMEMNLQLTDAVKRLKQIPDYDAWFNEVFPDKGITADTIVAAIATFERTAVASYAPFDAWIDGNETAISEGAKRGFSLFNGKAGCDRCHTGWNFTDNRFHDIGTTSTDIGRGALEPDNVLAQYAFKTPTLRDTAQRAPYMHDGSFATLEQFPVKWAHMQDNFGNAPEQWSARQDGAARLEQALGASREAPYGDCCDSNLHGREPGPEHDAMPKTTNCGSCSFPRK